MLSSACADGDALGILARQNVVGGEVADVGGGRHHRRRKARAFLVGPVADADRRLGFDAGIVERAHHFQRRQRAEHAVIFAAGRLGVEVGAEADRRLRHVAALAQAEHRAQRIDMHFQPGGLAARCGTSRAPACPQAPASAAARRLSAWRRIWRFREWCPTAGRNRFAGWRRFLSLAVPKFMDTQGALLFNDAPGAARQQ